MSSAIKISQQDGIKRIDSKLARLSEQYDEYARFQGQDVDELLDGILKLRQFTKENMIDLGFLLYLKVLRLKLSAFQLVADIKGMELATETRTTLDEIEEFYRQLEYELKRSQGLLGYSPIPESHEPPVPEPPVSILGSRQLFNTVTGFFDEVTEPGDGIGLPADLFEFYEHVDMGKVQDDVVRLVVAAGGRSTIQQVAADLDLGNPRKTVALVFMACLFLDIERIILLNQGVDDVFISIISFGN